MDESAELASTEGGGPDGTAVQRGRPFLDALPGLVRRVRRELGVSQRDLAAQLGVSQSRVARWETGRTIPSTADLEDVLALIGATLVAVDQDGDQVRAMNPLAVRDRADRRYPAHCDPRAEGWWSPPGSLCRADGDAVWRRSKETEEPCVTYDRGLWRSVMRAAYGTPPDHPTRSEVLEAMRTAPLDPCPPETPPDPPATPD